jgi:hypothetical protein
LRRRSGPLLLGADLGQQQPFEKVREAQLLARGAIRDRAVLGCTALELELLTQRRDPLVLQVHVMSA